MTNPLRFGSDYSERATLPDGTRLTLRTVRPTDKPLFVEGFNHLSEESRYRRFLGAKSSLSTAELRYLTENDGVDHLAIGAVRDGENGIEGLGVARIIRIPDRPDTAEAAVTVIDSMQGRGLGRLLGERLVAAAKERSINHFRVTLLAGNERARALLDETAPASILKPAIEESDGAMTFEVELPDPPVQPRELPLWRQLLSLAAGAYAITRDRQS